MKMNEVITFDVMFMETIYPWLYGLKNINMLLMKKVFHPKFLANLAISNLST